MKRVLILALTAAALSAPSDALATNECDGLDVCISVPGPWVVVPGSSSGRFVNVEYQLACPRGTIAGGLDAVLGHRALSVQFLGRLGSPVNPGITTERAVVFVASQARRSPTVFRPVLGCIPTGGGGRSTTAARPAPARPPARLVRSVRVRPGAAATLALGCRPGERLVASSHAVAFRGRRRPAATALAAMTVVRREQGGVVEIRAVRGAGVPRRASVEVQVHAICARGPA